MTRTSQTNEANAGEAQLSNEPVDQTGEGERSEHPWRAKAHRSSRPKGSTRLQSWTSAVWLAPDWLFSIRAGKPYADWAEWEARRTGGIVGSRWIGEDPPASMIQDLVERGIISAACGRSADRGAARERSS